MVAPVTFADAETAVGRGADAEWLVARLTQVAYDVALRHGPDRPFTELELALWREIRAVISCATGAEET
jgi:hypothetical protein